MKGNSLASGLFTLSLLRRTGTIAALLAGSPVSVSLIPALAALPGASVGSALGDQLLSGDRLETEPPVIVTPKGPMDRESVIRVGLAGSRSLSVEQPAAVPDPSANTGSVNVFSDASAGWWDGFGAQGMNHSVFALTSFDNGVVAGGRFTDAGTTSDVGHIALWNGYEWLSLGGGVSGPFPFTGVHATIRYGNDLIATGNFADAGEIQANNIARWDGTAWHPLGSGLNASGNVLAVYKNTLIVGGGFWRAGDLFVGGIAQWDGAQWHALESGVNGTIWSLLPYRGTLIAGGDFTEAGDIDANCIAQWNGSSWSPMGSGLDYPATDLAVYDGSLVASGRFIHPDDQIICGLATWDGVAWTPVLGGVRGLVSTLESYGKRLIAGGEFNRAGNVAVSNIAEWNGTTWSSLDSGVNDVVFELALIAEGDGAAPMKRASLFVGGQFTEAGGYASLRIGKWQGGDRADLAASSSMDGHDRGGWSVDGRGRAHERRVARVSDPLRVAEGIPPPRSGVVSVIDLAGRSRSVFQHHWKRGSPVPEIIGLPAGIYFVRWGEGRAAQVRKVVITR